ncbi:MAG: hypothetical protein ACRBCL_10455 [Maritimibacter sp.]
MRNAFSGVAVFAACALLAGSAFAAPVDGNSARKQLFRPNGMVVKPLKPQGLDKQSQAVADGMIQNMRSGSVMKQFEASGYGYYGAVALPKSAPEGQANPTVVVQLHSPEAAQRAAITECQKTNGGTCVPIALMLPKGYRARDLTLSQDATKRVVGTWKDGGAPKYLAYSPTTHGWGIAKGASATPQTAIDSCNQVAKRSDCVVAIEDK